MSGPDPEISVVAPTYRRPDRLRRLVAALGVQDLEPERWELIVVDDASPDETGEVLDDLARASRGAFRAVHRAVNGGPAAARNEGARCARAGVVAFVDDDCVPEPGWARAMAGAFARNPRLGVVQGLTRRPEEPLGPWTLYREITWESPWFEGCNIAYRRDLLLATGGFDESIGWYGEDTSAGWKVLDTGAERDFEPNAVVTHDLEERGLGWRVRHGWLERNLVELAARHPGLRASAFWRPWAFRRESVAFPIAVLGLLAAVRRPSAALLALPYVLLRRRSFRRPQDALGVVAIDAAQLVGHLDASLRHGTLVL
ncbi:MAG: glycosyltransferase [Acidimicrobiales bacterium]